MTARDLILEPFAGPGGATLGLHALGLTTIGIEWDRDACATRAAAGLPTIRADVARFPLDHLAGRVRGLWGSPPCPTFSTAGKGSGRDEVPDLLAFTAQFAEGGWHDPWEHHDWDDPRTPLVLEPLRFVEALDPDWVVLEQVPPVEVLWAAYARVLADRGFSTWAGILNAADFGVPQTRRRAFLLASKVRTVHPPAPTHAKDPQPTLFGQLLPWVTMAEALGWEVGGTVRTGANTMKHGRTPDDVEPYERSADTPAPTLDAKAGGAWSVGFPRRNDRGETDDGYRDRDWREVDEPAPTITEKARSLVLDRRSTGTPLLDPATDPAPTVTMAAIGRSLWQVREGTLEDEEPASARYARRAADTFCSECATTDPRGADPGPWHPPACSMHEAVEVLNPGLTGTQPNRRRRPVTEPAPTLAFGKDSANWCWERPATTLAGDPRIAAPVHHRDASTPDAPPRMANAVTAEQARVGDYDGQHAIRLTKADALILQAFPAGWPVVGSRTSQFTQIGNAVPPPLAAAAASVVI